MIRIGLIQFPGANCEREAALAVKRAGMEAVDFLWNEPLEKLRSFQGYIIVGGFSYEDRARAGIIAALDPVIEELKVQSEQGKPILGICNGAQILVESGLVPAINTSEHLALTENKRVEHGKIVGTGFYNVWVNMRLSTHYQNNAFTRYLSPKNIIHLPIAHGEGRFLMSDSLLKELETQGLNLFQYCDSEGNVINNFPINPNGSVGNSAALINKTGNVMAMMPHPERTPNGDPIFASIRDYIVETQTKPLNLKRDTNSCLQTTQLRNNIALQNYVKIPTSYCCLVRLIITDNHALTVQKTLRRLGFPVNVTRLVHWEIECDSSQVFECIKRSELLYSPRKEREISLNEFTSETALSYLVRAQEDLKGQQTLQTLKTHYGMSQISRINHSVVWQFTSDETNISTLSDSILLTHIIGNPYAHQCYLYDHSVWQ
jgi:phosphoribosylformylglycinamidine synthase I